MWTTHSNFLGGGPREIKVWAAHEFNNSSCGLGQRIRLVQS